MQVLTSVMMKIQVFWRIMPYWLVNSYWLSNEHITSIYRSCNPMGDPAKCENPWNEFACSLKSSVTIYKSTLHNISEALKLKKYHIIQTNFHANTAHFATKVMNKFILQWTSVGKQCSSTVNIFQSTCLLNSRFTVKMAEYATKIHTWQERHHWCGH